MYNIDITSDIHTSLITSKYKDVFWVNWVLKQSQNSEYLIIAWDINEDVFEIEKILNNIIDNSSYKKIIITFWNHDIWYRSNNSFDRKWFYNNSIEKYYFLIETFHGYKNKVHVIDKEDFIIENKKLILTWNMWWYNYSINDLDKKNLLENTDADFDKMTYGTFGSNDRIFVKFSESIKWNIDFAEVLENQLIDRLTKIQNNSQLNWYKVLSISHVKPSYKLEHNSPFFLELTKEEWNNIISEWIDIHQSSLQKIYSNAFYINNNLSKVYDKYWVNYSIYWHTHQYYKKNINGVKYITNSFWYYLWEKNNSIITI